MTKPSAISDSATENRRKIHRQSAQWRKELWGWIRTLAIAFGIVLLLRTYVFQISTVRSISMQPTLYEREWLFINKVVYVFGHPKRGDVIILQDPEKEAGNPHYLVKRVIGEPGDTVEIRNGFVYVNGERLVEPYTDTVIEDGDMSPVRVSAGHYFVMGDNRRFAASRDSRSFREVPEERIVGRAEFILWPVTSWKRL
jgi:signal peptidase I